MLKAKLETKTNGELFDIIKALVNKFDDASQMVFDLALDVFSTKVSEEQLCEALAIIEKMQDA